MWRFVGIALKIDAGKQENSFALPPARGVTLAA
ncbi:hypothetical protein A2U01_0118681, partial [Trifolium medium]|nr:hypothetical protein [Trifolium medium]